MTNNADRLSLDLLAHRLKRTITKIHSRPVNGKTRPCCYLNGTLMTCVDAREKLLAEYKEMMKIR